MGRRGKDVYQRIEDTRDEIKDKELELADLKEQLEELYKERDDLEMRKIFSLVKENGMSVDDIAELINKPKNNATTVTTLPQTQLTTTEKPNKKVKKEDNL